MFTVKLESKRYVCDSPIITTTLIEAYSVEIVEGEAIHEDETKLPFTSLHIKWRGGSRRALIGQEWVLCRLPQQCWFQGCKHTEDDLFVAAYIENSAGKTTQVIR